VPYGRRKELRGQLGLPADAFVLYTPNRVHASKGQDLLAAALASIPELLDRHNVLWVNTGLVQHRQVEKLMRESLSPIAAHARLLPPVGNPEDWIAASDAVVVPSRTESFPNVILEAGAVGRPLLTTACGAAATVGPELGAVVVKPGSVRALAQGLAELLTLDEATRRTIGESAHQVVAGLYN
jgi:glycosyltransferase involved in cell wall biosynthesis